MRRLGFVFGDIHFPFHHKIVLACALYICIKKQPKYIVQVGDLNDYYSAAKFPRSYNVMTPREETSLARGLGERFWSLLHKYCPQAEKHQILGNHCVRPIKRIMENAPEFEDDMVRSLQEKYTFDNVKTVFDTRDELIIDDVWFQHGHLSQLGAHAAFNHKNTVVGHTHRAGIAYHALNGHLQKQIWEANAGYLADPHSKGLSYTAQKKATKWTHSCLEIDQFGPKVIQLYPAMATNMLNDPLFKECIFE